MELIAKDDGLVDKLVGAWSLFSSVLEKISIYSKDHLVCIDVEIAIREKEGKKKILLRFVDVDEYHFYHSSAHIFYNVEICKFFKSAVVFYISFDPVDETEIISDEDQDFIKAKSVEGYLLEPPQTRL